jgi:hypothetical protein
MLPAGGELLRMRWLLQDEGGMRRMQRRIGWR